jgi:TolB-like protein
MAQQLAGFGPFVLDRRNRILLREGVAVPLNGRGFALLGALIDAGGEVVTKAQLMDAAWPNASIEESNLTVQIAALRKSLGVSPLGQDWIVTVPRLGYRLLAEAPASVARSSGARPAGKLAVAVLPFANLSNDQAQSFFVDGIAEDLITDLSKIPGVTVIARHSSFAYQGRTVDIRTIASELGVQYLIQGSVRRAEDRLRINAQVIDAGDSSTLWADRFDRDLADVFKLQDEVVARIVSALVGKLPSASALPMRRAANLAAYDAFVRGRLFASQMTEDNKEARPLLARAIALDPNFADAHACLARSHHFAWTYWAEPAEPHRSLSLTEARRAVALDPESSVAHAILGDVLVVHRQPHEGAAHFDRALHINPSDADAWTFKGTALTLDGRVPEGIEAVRNALRLNPYAQGWYIWALGFCQYAAGDYPGAVETLSGEATRRMGSRRILAASLAQLGRLDEARAEASGFLAANPHFSAAAWGEAQPFRLQADLQHFIDGYVKAGLPG